MNRVQALKMFFDDRPVTMEEMKALGEADRAALADMVKAECIRRGTHTAADFAF